MAEKVINGDTFKIDTVLGSRALVLQARLLKAAGPLAERLPAALSVASKNVTDEQKAEANAAMLSAIADIFARMEPDEMASLVIDIVGLAKIRRPSGAYDPVDFDGDFTGKLGSVIPVAAFVLKEVFGDFFRGLLALGNQSKVGLA